MADHTLFNCYSALGIDAGATYCEIKAAFRELSKLSHPDVGACGSSEEQVRLNLAYEILRDPLKRDRHDRFWKVREPRQRLRERKVRVANQPAKKRETAERYSGNYVSTAYEHLLSRLRKEMQEKETEIKASEVNRSEQLKEKYVKRYKRTRAIFIIKGAIALAISCASMFSLIFLIAGLIAAAILLVPNLIVFSGQGTVFVLSPSWRRRVGHEARLASRLSIERELRRLAQYPRLLKIIKEEMIRGSRVPDNEEAVAGRIGFAFFLSGFIPEHYDPLTRTMLLSAGGDKVLVRYRHRKGSPVNVSYVKKLISIMGETAASSGFIFASPGLSGKARSLARDHSIRAYSLKEMNDWMKSVYSTPHRAARDSILSGLDSLFGFLRELAGR